MPNFEFFPLHTSTGLAPSYREVLSTYNLAFRSAVKLGTLRPLIAYSLYGYLLLFIYLSIPHTERPWLYKARWLVLGVISYWQWKTIWETSSMSAGIGFVAGLTGAWGWFLSFTWLVFYRPQWDAKRVQKMVVERSGGSGVNYEGGNAGSDGMLIKEISNETNGYADVVSNGNSNIRQRPQNVGPKESKFRTTGMPNGSTTDEDAFEYCWQKYPEKVGERLGWLFDLIFNFRGPGWNWAIPPLPAPPAAVMGKLSEPIEASSKTGISYVGIRRYDTPRELFNAQIPRFVVGYFVLDFLKTFMMKDPYFVLGPNSYQLPPHLQTLSPLARYCLRQLTTFTAVITSIEMAFLCAPIGMSLILGPRVIGQRADTWYYATTWGSFTTIFDKGLNGLWGSWWHQTFRFIFTAPTNFLVRNEYIPAHSTISRLFQLISAFGISSVLHWAGSISQLPKTNPLDAPAFFMLQALGIFLQTTFCLLFNPYLKPLPKNLRQVGNFGFTFVWLMSTSWLLSDDFARGGIWLWEPIPFSPLRGLGFGVEGDGWWCWQYMGSGWHSGKGWWDSGLAVF